MHQIIFEPIEKILAEYPVVLIDGCALQVYLTDGRFSRDKIEDYKLEIPSREFFIKLLDGGANLFTSRGTLDKHFGVRSGQGTKVESYKDRLREHGSLSGPKLERERLRWESIKLARRLADAFVSKERIYYPSREELPIYKSASEKYNYLGAQLDLHSADLDLIMMELARTKLEQGTALITCNLRTLRAWTNVLLRENLKDDMFSLYLRKGMDTYQRAYPNLKWMVPFK